MEDAVESLVVEEESKKSVKTKSRFRRRRTKSSENNNSSLGREPAAAMRGKDEKSLYNGSEEPMANGKLRNTSSPAKNSSCLLLRLFESKLFDMSIAIAYLFKSKESGVQAYLGNKLFVSIAKYFVCTDSTWVLLVYLGQ